MWFAAICARWGVTCTAQDGGPRAIFQATAARRQIQPRRAIFQATAHRWTSTSCDDKLRSDHGAPFFKRQRIADRRHHATTICGKLVTEVAMHSPLLVCADRARTYRCLDDTSTPHGKVGLCLMQCLLCTACPACDVVLLNALLCVHATPACILFCGVLLLLACSCQFSLTTLAGCTLPCCSSGACRPSPPAT